MSYIYDLLDTWNDGATTFTAIKMNVTDTASNAASLLMDLQVGPVSKFRVSKGGEIQLVGGGNYAGFRSEANTGGVFSIGTAFVFGYSSSEYGVGLQIRNNGAYGWSSSTGLAPTANIDTLLTRRAAANLRFGAADVGAIIATVTITIAAPGVVTWSGHGFSTGTPVVFTTTGALPTGITSGTTYYAVVVTDSTFQLATSVANAVASTPTVITTSGSQSGTHTGTRYNITQRLSMQSITGVTDRLGADLLIQGSQGTGTGAGGSIIFQVAPAGSTGTAQNALATALTIDSTGKVAVVGPGSSANPSLQIGESSTTGFMSNGSGFISFTGTNGIYATFSNGGGLRVAANVPLEWSNTSGNSYVTGDLQLWRDDSNKLALRNGTAAQAFNLYGTYTDASNYRRAALAMTTAGVATLKPEGAGTGASGNVLHISGLPTSNPGPGILWNNAGTPAIGT